MYLLLTNNYIYAIRNRYNVNRDKGILKLKILVIVFFIQAGAKLPCEQWFLQATKPPATRKYKSKAIF